MTWSFHHLTIPPLDSYRGVTLMTIPCRHEELNHHCLRSTNHYSLRLKTLCNHYFSRGSEVQKGSFFKGQARTRQFQTSQHLCCKSDHSVGQGNLQTIQIAFKNSRHSDTPPLVLHLDISCHQDCRWCSLELVRMVNSTWVKRSKIHFQLISNVEIQLYIHLKVIIYSTTNFQAPKVDRRRWVFHRPRCARPTRHKWRRKMP